MVITYNGNIVTCPSGKWVGTPEGPWPVPNYYDNCVEVVAHLPANNPNPSFDVAAMKSMFEDRMSGKLLSYELTAQDSSSATYKVTWGTGRTDWSGAFSELVLTYDMNYYFDVTKCGTLLGTDFSSMFFCCAQVHDVCGLCTASGTDFRSMFSGSGLISLFCLHSVALPDMRNATDVGGFMWKADSMGMQSGYKYLYDMMSSVPGIVSHSYAFDVPMRSSQQSWFYYDPDDPAGQHYVQPPPEWPGFAELDQIPSSWGGTAP